MTKLSIAELSVIELKAMAYDEFVKLEMAQTNLRTINAEIDKKSHSDVTLNGNA